MGDSSSLDEDEAGLLWLPREMLDILRSQNEPGLLFFSLSAEDSLSEAQGRRIPCLLTELSRDSVPLLVVVVEGVTARTVFLLKIEVESRRSVRSGTTAVDDTGCEVAGRGEKERDGETGDCVVALEPGDFLLPGLMRNESPLEVPNAKPVAAIPMVPIAHSWKVLLEMHQDDMMDRQGMGMYGIYRSNMFLTVVHRGSRGRLPSRQLSPELPVYVHMERPHGGFTISCKSCEGLRGLSDWRSRCLCCVCGKGVGRKDIVSGAGRGKGKQGETRDGGVAKEEKLEML